MVWNPLYPFKQAWWKVYDRYYPTGNDGQAFEFGIGNPKITDRIYEKRKKDYESGKDPTSGLQHSDVWKDILEDVPEYPKMVPLMPMDPYDDPPDSNPYDPNNIPQPPDVSDWVSGFIDDLVKTMTRTKEKEPVYAKTKRRGRKLSGRSRWYRGKKLQRQSSFWIERKPKKKIKNKVYYN